MQSPSPIATTRLRTAQRLLVLLVAVLGMVVATTAVASASTVSQLARSSGPAALPVSETRVGVARFAAPLFVGLQQTVSPGHVEQMCPRFLQTVSGSCVATKPGAGAVDDVLGGLSKGKSAGVKTVGSEAELQSVFDDLAKGGSPAEWSGYKGTVVRRPDGVEVGIRSGSKSGGATVDIRVPGQAPKKVHIR